MSTATYVQRLRVTFSKQGATRYISHLDMARTWERALNRAKMPVTYSQGFNRHPKIQFATATPLGMTSECELMDVWLDERVPPAQAHAMMMSRMAPGIEVLQVVEVPLRGAALQTLTRETVYEAVIPADILPLATLQERVAEFLAAESVWRERQVKRRVKKYDLRPLVLGLEVVEANTAVDDPTNPDHDPRLIMHLRLEPGHTGRPDELLLALGAEPLDVRMHRLSMSLAPEPALTDTDNHDLPEAPAESEPHG